MARNTSFRCKVRGAKPSRCFRAPKWCENTQNMSFGPKRVHWNLSSSKSRVLLFWNVQSNAPRYKFLQQVGCIDEMARNHLKMSFGPNVVDWACSLLENKKRFSSAATKWHGTTQNMSFRPEIVDWACSLWQTRNGFSGINSCIKCTPMLIFTMG